MLSLDQSDNRQHFRLSATASFALSLRETPTTGFRWSIAQLPPFIRLVADKFEASSTTDPGAPGSHRWVFEARNPGAGELRLELVARTARDTEPVLFTVFLAVAS
jgi:predicted secreted protein